MNKQIDISNTTLKTQRLTLRPFQQDDLDDFFEYAKVDGVGQMAGWAPHENKSVSQIILDSFINGKKTFALIFNNKVIGSLGIEEYKEDHYPTLKKKEGRELGYVLSKDYWGQGLMVEACKEVLRYLFEDAKLDFVTCGHFKNNKQSARVQEKLGFHYYGEGMYHTRLNTDEPCIFNILTREDFFIQYKNGVILPKEINFIYPLGRKVDITYKSEFDFYTFEITKRGYRKHFLGYYQEFYYLDNPVDKEYIDFIGWYPQNYFAPIKRVDEREIIIYDEKEEIY